MVQEKYKPTKEREAIASIFLLVSVLQTQISRKDILLASLMAIFIPFGYNLTKIAMPLKFVSVGIEKGILILPILVGDALQLLVRPISGVLADKYGHKRFLFVSPLLYALAFIIMLKAESAWGIYVAMIVLGIAVASFWSVFLAYSSYIDLSISKSVGYILMISFIGALIGTVLSGYIYEYYGSSTVFLISAISCIIVAIASIGLKPIKTGDFKANLDIVMRIAVKNVKDILENSNTISLRSVINTYAPILLIDAGLRPTIVGVIMVILPAMYAIMQYVGGVLYSKIVLYRAYINMIALALLILFVVFCINAMIYLAIIVFFMYGIMSSLLFTPQLSKSIDTDSNMRATATGSFGVGMILGRILASAISATCGYIAETSIALYSSPHMALMGVGVCFLIITVGVRIPKL